MFNREIDLEGCLQQYIENKLTCSIPWGPRNFSHYPNCETKEQLKQYYKLIVKIRYLGERGIYDETGCKSSCHVNIYNLDKRWDFRDDSVKDQVINATGWPGILWTWLELIMGSYFKTLKLSSPSRLSSISITMEGNTRGSLNTTPTAQSPSSQTLEATW